MTAKPTQQASTRTYGFAPTALIVAAYTVVYLAWGGTYLGIRVAIETIPVFLMVGSRFLLAGLILLAGLRFLNAGDFRWGTRREWRDASVAGLLLLLIGNGGVSWAERTVPSGVAALFVAVTPLWMVLFEWLRPGGRRPSLRAVLGLLLGFGGILILRSPGHDAVGTSVMNWGFLALFVAGVCWGGGAIYSRYVHAEGSPLLPMARQMIVAGLALLAVSAATGELHSFAPASITLRSVLGYAYLVTCGSLLGFTSYAWLMKVSTPARVGTISYVNPVIAVLLGWAIGGEALTLKIAASAAVIVVSVIIVLKQQDGEPDVPK